MSHVLSRRGFLKGLATVAGAAAGARIAGGPLVGRALAAGACGRPASSLVPAKLT